MDTPLFHGKVREIVLYGDPVLRQVATPVGVIDSSVRELVADMTATLRDAQGLGLAANQIGVAQRIFIIDLSLLEIADEVRVFVNPEIVSATGESEYEEGCLSLPDVYERVTRPATVHLRAQDMTGRTTDITVDEVYARVIQHELDHLNGKLFIDHLSTLTRQLLSGKLRRIKAENRNA